MTFWKRSVNNVNDQIVQESEGPNLAAQNTTLRNLIDDPWVKL